MVASLEETISLMEPYGVDVTSFKRVLLATTGDINADVLEWNVARELGRRLGTKLLALGRSKIPRPLWLSLALFLGILYVDKFTRQASSKNREKECLALQDGLQCLDARLLCLYRF